MRLMGKASDEERAQQTGLSGKEALAGYIDTASGRWPAFALDLNNLPITGIEDVLAANRTLGAMAATIYAEQ